MTQKEIFIVEKPVFIDEVTLTSISRISIKWDEHCWTFYATKQPVFLIVSANNNIQAFSITGEKVPVENLAKLYPDLI